MKLPPGRRTASIAGYAVLTLILTAGTAQSLAGSNTVYSDDLVDGQVSYADIRNNAVTGAKILNSSIHGPDIAPNTLTGADIDEATLTGRITGIHIAGAAGTAPGTSTGVGTGIQLASCPQGETVLSGGGSTTNTTALTLVRSFPTVDLSGWYVAYRNSTSTDLGFSVYAICASVS